LIIASGKPGALHFDQVKSRDAVRLMTSARPWRTPLRNVLSRLANAHPLKQALAVVAVLLVAAAAFEGWGLLTRSTA